MDALLAPFRRRLLAAGGAAALLAACGERAAGPRTAAGVAATPDRWTGLSMGTDWTLKLGREWPAARWESLAADVQAALDAVDRSMSIFRPDSELARFNAHAVAAPFACSAELGLVLRAAQATSALSDGAFDVTVAPLVEAWGFGTVKRSERPPAGELQARRGAVGWRGIVLDPAGRTVRKADARLAADLGGIAKGYGVDRAAAALDAAGVEDYLLEVGGEVRARGRNRQRQAWRVGIEQPDSRTPRARRVVAMSAGALATSGDYRSYFEQGGRRYSHEIDPASGRPIAHGLASVSVLASDAMAADALATALIVLGPERGMALAERERIPAYFIVRDAAGRLRDASSSAFPAV